MNKKNKKVIFIIFFLISLIISYFLLGLGHSLLWKIVIVPLYSLWLTGPVFLLEEENPFVVFPVWVIAQIVILFLFGLWYPLF